MLMAGRTMLAYARRVGSPGLRGKLADLALTSGPRWHRV
jgi:hypothetical protein